MTPEVEALYQQIGHLAVKEASGASGRLLIYAEVEEGVSSADMFYVRSARRDLRFRFCSPELRQLIVALWENWKKLGKPEWRALNYVVDGGSFKIDLVYPEEMSEEEDVSDRRPRAVQRYFGNMPIDYSSPD